MSVKERISALLHDYCRKNGRLPSRITVSSEVARELDAVREAENVKLDSPLGVGNPKLLQEGHSMWFRGVPLVADLEPADVLDIR